ncbi:caspase family protein [Acrocarpospora sp. B8E8]|uniref:caspase family protein n=1 Tax=Acrocarpospora sp. B8E8 TaxID=3153572 RepID=UPI00325EF455
MLHAVLVGIDRYRDRRIRNLRFARSDAEAVARLLTRVDPAERDIRLLLDEEATKHAIMTEIGVRLRGQAGPDDVVLIYFAGHGSPEQGQRPDDVARYLVTHDTEKSNIYATAIDFDNEINRWFERIDRPKLVLMLIDSCFSGGAGGRTFMGPELQHRRAGSRAPISLSLKDLDLGEGKLIITACGEDERAEESPAVGGGVFTHFLIKGPAAAGENTVGLHSLYEQVARSVRDWSRKNQNPIIYGRSSYARFPNVWSAP